MNLLKSLGLKLWITLMIYVLYLKAKKYGTIQSMIKIEGY